MELLSATSIVLAILAVQQDYYPLKEGTTWTYATEDGKETVKKVGTKKNIDGVEGVEVHGFGPWGVFQQEPTCMVLAREGMKIHLREFKDILWLKLPLKEGEKWKSGPFDVEVLAEEEVEVPAGRYRTFKVRARFGDPEGTAGEWTTWYAAGVGEVQSTVTVAKRKKAPQTITRSLKKFDSAGGK